MSKHTLEYLNFNTLIGFAAKRGKFWHYRAEMQGEESNHYDGAIPVEDVRRRLFHWHAVSAPVQAQYALPEAITRPNGDVIYPAGELMTVTDDERQVILRPDTNRILGVFKSGYTVHQYDEWLIDTVARMLDDDLMIGSAGILDHGGMAWVQIEMPDSRVMSDVGEVIRPYFLATTSMNGKLATTYKRGFTRVGCDNTLEMGVTEDAPTTKIKHTVNGKVNIDDERSKHDLIVSYGDSIEEAIRAEISQPVDGKLFIKWLDNYVPIPATAGRAKTMAERKREEFLTLWTNDERVAPWAGTRWGIRQAANTHAQHFAPVSKGADRGQRNMLGAATGKLFDADNSALALLDRLILADA